MLSRDLISMFTSVIVGVDGREGGHAAIALAKQLAAPEAKFVFANFYGAEAPLARAARPGSASTYGDSQSVLIRERHAAAIDARLVSVPGSEIGIGLARLVTRHEGELLAVGSSRRGPLGRVVLGNDATLAVRNAPCPVAVAPEGYTADGRLSRIGVAYDGSAESIRGIEAARGLAAQSGGTVRALMVVPIATIPYDEPVRDRLPDAAKHLVDESSRREHGLTDVDGDIAYGQPGPELARFSRDLDLLVVGSRRLGPMDRLIEGSTSDHLMRNAQCPLLVIPR